MNILFWPFVTSKNERQIAVRERSPPFAVRGSRKSAVYFNRQPVLRLGERGWGGGRAPPKNFDKKVKTH
jgi:hypothetical protein